MRIGPGSSDGGWTGNGAQAHDRRRWVALAAAAIGAGVSIYNNKKKDKQAKEAANSASTAQSTSTPTFDPRFAKLIPGLINTQQAKVNRGFALPEGFKTNAIESINKAGAGAKTSLESSLAARGLGTSPVAASALAGLEQNRAAQIGDLGVELPMLEKEQQDKDFQQLLSLLSMGKGQATSTQSTGTNPLLPGQIGKEDVGSDLALQLGMWWQNRQNGAGSNGGYKNTGEQAGPPSWMIAR